MKTDFKETTSTPIPATTTIPTQAGSTYRKYLTSVIGSGDDDDEKEKEKEKPVAPQPVSGGVARNHFAGRFCASCGNVHNRCCSVCFTPMINETA